jgi:hypothetical protein
MNSPFDSPHERSRSLTYSQQPATLSRGKLTKSLAQSVTRRAALKKFGVGLGGMALACFVMAPEANAAPLEAPFSKITNGVLVTESAISVSSAWGDFDHDGWLDLFVGNLEGSNSLFRNNRDGTFTKVTANPIATDPPSHANGAWADYDNDGQLDLIIANLTDSSPSLSLYRATNGSHIRMTAASAGSPAADFGRATAGSWADYDQDGYLDLFVARGALVRDVRDALYHNDRNGRFSSVTNPITLPALRSCQGSWADFDNDGDVDLFITHAANQGNSLFRNNGQGQFVDVTQAAGVTNRGDSVGAAWGDYDNDGDLDLFVTNLRLAILGGTDTPNFLYRNNGNGTFTQITAGEIATDTGHFLSCAWVDYDNDGWLDLFVTFDPPAASPPTAVKNRLYHNQGDGTFVEITAGTLVTDYANAGGAAWGDYDQDGFPDVFIANGTIYEAQRNALYRNQGNSNNWIKLKCVGTLSNRSAIGTKIRVKATIGGKEVWQMRQISGGEGWLGFNSLDVIIGLGDASVTDLLRLEWPSGVVQEIADVPVRQVLEIIEPIQLADILVPRAGSGSIELRLTGTTARRLRVSASSDLIRWSAFEADWQEGDRLSFTDPEAATATHRLYRVLSP